MIEEALNQLGVKCTSSCGFLPLTIEGPITGGHCEIDGSVSSQLLDRSSYGFASGIKKLGD